MAERLLEAQKSGGVPGLSSVTPADYRQATYTSNISFTNE